VSVSLSRRGIRAIVLDIEGTTTPMSFVYDVLFPYVRAHVREHLDSHGSAGPTAEALSSLREEFVRDRASGQAPPGWDGDQPASATPYVEWLMDRDRKSFGLKLLQGEIWRRGYADGSLKGDVFPDVPPALTRRTDAGLRVAIYSSGSVLAQSLLFGHTAAGDLTRFLSACFDTATGPKTAADSYRAIARALGVAEGEVLFASDASGELAAAASAGCQTVQCDRPGNRTAAEWDPTITSFDEIE